MTQRPRARTAPAARELITIAEAAERLHCGNQTIRDLIARGQLPAYRIGDRLIRVYLDDVDALLRPIPTVGRPLRQPKD